MHESDMRLSISLLLKDTWPRITPGIRGDRDFSLFVCGKLGRLTPGPRSLRYRLKVLTSIRSVHML